MYTAYVNASGHVVISSGRDDFLVVGVHTAGHTFMWASWYTEWLNLGGSGRGALTDGPPRWPITGLQSFRTDEEILFVYDGLPVGTIGWNGLEWWWYMLSPDGNLYGKPEHIDVDPDQRQAFQEERQKVALGSETILPVLMAELEGRIRLFRDESRDLVMMFGRSKARRLGLHRKNLGRDA